MDQFKQPWLSNPFKECVFILAPALLPVVIIYAFQDYFTNHHVSGLWWVLLVLCIDVSHVYSTLFRLYWDKSTFVRHKRSLIIIPVVAFLIGFALHCYDALVFWRVLAYVAVFHFVRQQYGFMRLYSRKEKVSRTFRAIDTLAIYNATLYPLLYWHFHARDSINWFVEGDFMAIPGNPLQAIIHYIYGAIILLYAGKEITFSLKNRTCNIPKNLIMLGTYVSWYVGIVAFQGDLIFTLLNVVAHGIPYMALIWIYGEKKAGQRFDFGWKGLFIFAGVLLLLAYVEEGLWDVIVWKDHPEIFPFMIDGLSFESPLLISVMVSLLVLPQVTHYVLDGFIWRFSKEANARIPED